MIIPMSFVKCPQLNGDSAHSAENASKIVNGSVHHASSLDSQFLCKIQVDLQVAKDD